MWGTRGVVGISIAIPTLGCAKDGAPGWWFYAGTAVYCCVMTSA